MSSRVDLLVPTVATCHLTMPTSHAQQHSQQTHARHHFYDFVGSFCFSLPVTGDKSVNACCLCLQNRLDCDTNPLNLCNIQLDHPQNREKMNDIINFDSIMVLICLICATCHFIYFDLIVQDSLILHCSSRSFSSRVDSLMPCSHLTTPTRHAQQHSQQTHARHHFYDFVGSFCFSLPVTGDCLR